MKMCRTKLEPRNRSDQNTRRISRKFGMNVSYDHTNRTTEANFNIWPLSRVMGPQRGYNQESQKCEKIFPDFFSFLGLSS